MDMCFSKTKCESIFEIEGTKLFFDNILVNKHLKIKETLNYIYIAPHPLLSKYIAHYTISFPNLHKAKKCSENIKDLILIPDSSGCIIYTYENNALLSSVWGATTKTVTVKNDVNLGKIRFFIEFMPGGLTIKQLSANEYISERQLNRLFNEYIGVNAKLFSRIVRVNYSINMIKKLQHKSYLNLSQILGYFDEAHFIHDFKQICGVSPNSFFKNMSDFYNEPFKY